MRSKNMLRRLPVIIAICIVFILAMAVLHHNIGNAWITTDYRPELTDTPVYVEFSESVPLETVITPTEDFQLNGIEVVLVNISSDSRGTLIVNMTDAGGNVLGTAREPLSEITVGSWYEIGLSGYLYAGEPVTVTFTVDSGNPYFMSLSGESGADLPYELSVTGHGDAYISLGLQRVDITAQSFGDIFYYSIPICVILFVLALVWAVFGSRFTDFVKNIPIAGWLCRFGNEIFLILVFITICISIYSRSYMQSVYITSDSAGYLREATAIVNGYGFSYDGIAGYSTWFANWPILYPLLIAAMMVITGTDAYFASKLLSMLLVLVILIILYIYGKRDAWIYSLALLNTGFIALTWYTWSELPFMIFIMCFGMMLGRVVSEERPPLSAYILTGVFGLLTFLTRYYGLFVYFVLGAYIIYFFIAWIRSAGGDPGNKEVRDAALLRKWVSLLITAGCSGILSLLYLVINKIQNGMASGVARTMWWDDYGILTDDLITSLLTEFFHIFHLETPDLITELPVRMQVWILFILLIALAALIIRPLKKAGVNSVWIFMSLVYYVVFICIRYVSSMDTFYFRFFEPGTFILTLGILGYLIPLVRGRKNSGAAAERITPLMWGGIVISCIMLIVTLSTVTEGSLTGTPYCKELESTWDEAYADIPEKSVVIFSSLDFRSSWYRPGVVEGDISPDMTMDDIRTAYYGSDYMCISVADAETMIAEPVYSSDVEDAIRNALDETSSESGYIQIKLH